MFFNVLCNRTVDLFVFYCEFTYSSKKRIRCPLLGNPVFAHSCQRAGVARQNLRQYVFQPCFQRKLTSRPLLPTAALSPLAHVDRRAFVCWWGFNVGRSSGHLFSKNDCAPSASGWSSMCSWVNCAPSSTVVMLRGTYPCP